MRNLRIAITAQALTHGGGAERYTRDLVDGLHRLGIRPFVLARKVDPNLPQAALADALALSTRGIPRLWRAGWFDWRISRWLRQHPVDVVFAVNHSVHADVAVCGGTHPGFLRAMKKTATAADRRQIELERQTYAHARHIVAHSAMMASELQHHHGVSPERIEVVYPPVDASRFHVVEPATRAAMRQKLRLPTDRVVFLLASTGHVRKGLPELLQVFADAALPITLAVAGRPLGGRHRNVVELGYRTDMPDVFAAVDFTVIASRYEPFGLVGVESVLCGTPVIVSDAVGCAEVIAEDARIDYALSDPQGLPRALEVAFARSSGANARIADPRRALRYDPSIDAHLKQILPLLIDAAAARAGG